MALYLHYRTKEFTHFCLGRGGGGGGFGGRGGGGSKDDLLLLSFNDFNCSWVGLTHIEQTRLVYQLTSEVDLAQLR